MFFGQLLGWIFGGAVFYACVSAPVAAFDDFDAPDGLMVSTENRVIGQRSLRCQSGRIAGRDSNSVILMEPIGGGPIWCNMTMLHEASGWIQTYRIHKFSYKHPTYPNKATAVPMKVNRTPSPQFSWLHIEDVFHNEPGMDSFIFMW